MSAKIKPTPRHALNDADYEQLAEFRYVLRHFLIFSENAAASAGLSAQQHQALLAIKAARAKMPVTAGLLADRLAIRHHSAVGLIDRLEHKALIRRLRNPEDRRQVLILLTPAADRLLARLSAAHQRELKRIAPLLRGLLNHVAPH
jgi:DNA-binding MarR family transcriptional regulator